MALLGMGTRDRGRKDKQTQTRIDCFDLECTDLKANFGHILVACFLPVHAEDVAIFRLDDKKYRGKKEYDDSKLVEAVKRYMEESFCWIGWNSKLFDWPYINTRLLHHNISPINKRMHIDLMYFARRPNLALHSSRLDAVAKYFDFHEQKTEYDPKVWQSAEHLDKQSMDIITEHCIQDVKALKEAFQLLHPFIRTIHY